MFPNTNFMPFADSLTDREADFVLAKRKLVSKTKELLCISCDYKYTIYSSGCFNLPGLSGTWITL